MRSLLFSALSLVAILPASRAVILYGLDNTANTTNPGTGAPWDSVAKVTDASGSFLNGSAVYLGNGYIITANHVDTVTNAGYVSFDGTTTLAIDTSFSAVQISSGGIFADAKILKLVSIPTIAGVNILSSASEKIAAASPASVTAAAVTLVGWGVGRNATAVNTGIVGWGGASGKHWGTNTLNTFSLLSPANQPTYSFLSTHMGQGSPSEAGASLYDSGSGLFQNISGTWYFVGLTTIVAQQNGANTTTFGTTDTYNNANGDENLFVRMSSYSSQIQAITAVPEPATYASFVACAAAGAMFMRRRQRAKSAASAR